MTKQSNSKNWVRQVKTVSTFPSKDLFTRDAETIAKEMASQKVSPKGIGSGIRMVQYYINRAGKDLPAERRRELERAKKILQEKAQRKESSERNPAEAECGRGRTLCRPNATDIGLSLASLVAQQAITSHPKRTRS